MYGLPFTEIEISEEHSELQVCSICGHLVEPRKDKNITINIGDADLSIISPIPVRALICPSCIDDHKDSLKHFLRMSRLFLISLRSESVNGFIVNSIGAINAEQKVPPTRSDYVPPCWNEQCGTENPSGDCGICTSKRNVYNASKVQPLDKFPADFIKEVNDFMDSREIPPHIVEAYHHGVRGWMATLSSRLMLIEQIGEDYQGKVRKITEEEAKLLKAFFIKEHNYSMDEAQEMVSNYYYMVLENFQSESPGYMGKVIVGIYSNPETYQVFIVTSEGLQSIGQEV